MDWENQYLRSKARLLEGAQICKENRELFRKFFEFEEYKLKRRNGLRKLDRGCYRTLLTYGTRFRTVNRWFKNKPWVELTKADIQQVYDDLEEGRIKTMRGEPVRDRASLYNKVFRGKPFQLAGKADLAREVLAFSTMTPKQEVRFITEETFRQLVEVAASPLHRLLLWLCFDIGENASSILVLRKSDCVRQVNTETNEPEYRVNLRRETLKRSRRARSEITNYRETTQLLDLILNEKGENEPLFSFGPAQAAKILRRAVRITKAKCLPGGEPVTLKDLRSSMACDLLSKRWTTDEVNARLGHKPSSRELDKYVNFLALNRERPKRQFHETQITRLLEQIEKFRQREKLMFQRHEGLNEKVDRLERDSAEANRRLFEAVQQLAGHIKRQGLGAA